MPLNAKQLKQRAKEYVELEANTKVTDVEFIETFTLFGREDAVLSVKTVDKKFPEWWVVGGDTPMNLYDKKKFGSPDEAFSFHTGLMLRMIAHQNNDVRRSHRLRRIHQPCVGRQRSFCPAAGEETRLCLKTAV